MKKNTAKAELLRVLPLATEAKWSALHELPIYAHSQTALSARLRELARAGLVVGRRRQGEAVKEWASAIRAGQGVQA